MQHIQGGDRNQTLLLPVAVDDYVVEKIPSKDTGRPGYDPADLLKLYIYGYVNRVRSSRRLEAETARNLEVMWLLRGLRPDFKTIADFRKETDRLSSLSSANSCSSAANWTCSDENCLPSTGPG